MKRKKKTIVTNQLNTEHLFLYYYSTETTGGQFNEEDTEIAIYKFDGRSCESIRNGQSRNPFQPLWSA
jgi:hypothetical protein